MPIAYVAGDDLRPRAAELGFGDALTANAYLGAFGIAKALDAGARIVVTGRVTDASVVVGPAAHAHGWSPDDHDALAGAMIAGHVIECGCQATGGNFSGFRALARQGLFNTPIGFPLAEIAADGSTVITKHEGTGGAVTIDTVTAQLVYEIQSTRYLGPDVTADLTSIRLEQEAPDRVAITGVRGEAPPETLKVCVNELGGWRNSVEFVLTGLETEAKADWVREQMTATMAAHPPQTVHWSRTSHPHTDADTEEGASVLLRCSVLDPDAGPVGKPFTAAAVELALASYPGFTMTGPPPAPTPYGVYLPHQVPRSAVTHTVHHADGSTEVVPDPRQLSSASVDTPAVPPAMEQVGHQVRRVPLGTFVHARSGDKGGDANLGLWVARDDVDGAEVWQARVAWLTALITPAKVRELVPEAADLDIEVHRLSNLGGVNVLIRGLLGQGVASSTRFDPQAKGLGEWVRSRMVTVDEGLL